MAELYEMAELIEDAAYVLNSGNMVAGSMKCGPCGGKCYGPPPSCGKPCKGGRNEGISLVSKVSSILE